MAIAERWWSDVRNGVIATAVHENVDLGFPEIRIIGEEELRSDLTGLKKVKEGRRSLVVGLGFGTVLLKQEEEELAMPTVAVSIAGKNFRLAPPPLYV